MSIILYNCKPQNYLLIGLLNNNWIGRLSTFLQEKILSMVPRYVAF